MTVASVSVATVLALAPLRRPGLPANLSFRLTLVLNEVPFLCICWLLLCTAWAFSQGDVRSVVGWATVGTAALTAAGLVVIARNGMRAGPVVERALADALGPDRRTRFASEAVAGPRRRLPLGRILLGPFLRRRRDVERTANIEYGDAGRRNLLDVYHHRSRPSGGPVLIHLHGGAYDRGRKNSQSLPLIYRLASQGWVCVSANYRLRPDARHPDHLVDLKKVIAWVREHGHEYGADPSQLFASGSSAGAHLAALAALTPNDPAFQPGFEDVDTTVTAAVCLNGYYGDYYGQGPESSPLAYIDADAPPFFIAHGDHDTVVPVDAARRFADALREVSANPVVYAELPGAQHAFDLFRSFRFERVVDAIETFAARIDTRESAAEAGSGQP
ncbi:alpha/beta hydrolase [Embleya scabrispora]|uniref:alpha/beta hydrolase n=1 Tax=Embleya scabrispora TaxID=159449 RepID=UPI000367B120|nr:alpha/beta hydrolase [Embleya scabrispora]